MDIFSYLWLAPCPSVHVLSHISRVWLCDPMDCRPPGSSVHGILQARILEWVAVSFSRRASQCRDWIHNSTSPASAGGFCPSVSCRILNTRTWECQQKHPKKSLLNPSKPTGQLLLFSRSAMSDSLRPHGLQHARLPVIQYLLELLKLMSIESGLPSNHLILFHPLLLLPLNLL